MRRNLASTEPPSEVTDQFVKFDLQSSQLFVELDSATSMMKFTATVPGNSYFAIGFGESMKDTDMILC